MGYHTTDRSQAARAVGVFIVVALPLVAACGGGERRPPAAAGAGMPPAAVRLDVVRETPIEDASEYLATIQSMSSTLIKPQVSGEITKIYVRSGDRVAEGARLFQIDPRRQQASVSTQNAALAAQQAAATLAAQDLARAKTLFAAGAISQQQLDQAQANAESAQSQLAAQQARVQQERVTLQYYEVRAPGAGIVGDIPVREGLQVGTDTVLTSVDRNEQLEVDVQVPLERARDLRVGLPMQLLDNQGRSLGATTVFFVSPRVDDQTQSVLVKGHVAAAAAVRSAQFVRARLIWRTVPGLVVPLLSVVRVNGQPFVFVAKDAGGRLVAEQRLVTIGEVVGNDVTINRGLSANERIVVSGVQKLANGAPIRPA